MPLPSPIDTRKLRIRCLHVLLAFGTAVSLAACGGDDDDNGNPSTPPPAAQESATAQLALLASTDLHFNVRSYDYFKLAEDPSYGFERTATLIREARKAFPNMSAPE